MVINIKKTMVLMVMVEKRDSLKCVVLKVLWSGEGGEEKRRGGDGSSTDDCEEDRRGDE